MTTAAGNRDAGLLVTVGEFFLDLVFYDLPGLPQLGEELKTENFSVSPGGGAAITAAAASRLGRATRLMTVWGDSPFDVQVRSSLEEYGVDSSLSRTRGDTTSGFTVSVSTREDRYFLTYTGTNPFVEEYLLSPDGRASMLEGGHVHFALTPTDWALFGDLIEQLKEAGVSTSWDLGWDPAAGGSDDFHQLCAGLDLLFLNEMEALRYTGADDVGKAVQWLSSPANSVIVKQGEKGAAGVAQGGPVVRVKGMAVDAVDSTGAGDAFNGGFLHLWMEQAPLEDALLAGNICGGLSTRTPGGVASLPGPGEFCEQMETGRKDAV